MLSVRNSIKPTHVLCGSSWRVVLLRCLKHKEHFFSPDIGTSVTHKYSKASNIEAYPSHAPILKGTTLGLLLPREVGGGRAPQSVYRKVLPNSQGSGGADQIACLDKQVWC